jgi:multiple sugar transport system permease protein
MLFSAMLAFVTSIAFSRRLRPHSPFLIHATIPLLFGSGAYFLLQLTLSEIQTAVQTAQESGTELPIWSQIILISLGAALVGAAYSIWRRASLAGEDRRFILMSLAAVFLVGGGYFLVAEVPRALSEADNDVIQGFNVSVMFTLGTVPIQLTLALGLAYLLFQNIKGKALLRIIYFLPYITPWVATSVVFTLVFAQRSSSPANALLQAFGIPVQNWLLEPKGIFQLIFGPDIPPWFVGPSLALLVIMLFNIWTYTGYSTVIFLAGLGNIPTELYEAARIDGASGWKVFRHITLPMLSPTTFFLTLIATIGTFQAFTQIWLMRTSAARRTVDTINIYIFEEINAARPNYANGAAMAFVLFGVILVLTLLQNRFARRRVFYG